MKTLVLVALLVIAGYSYAGTLTIVPDSTSSMGKQKQIDDEIDRRRAAKRARIDAGLEPATVRPIIIQQKAKAHMDCYAYGNRRQFLSCD